MTADGDRHIVRWLEWGNPTNPNVLFCAHGLSRNARDFDFLARRMARDYRVICPDYPGRGASDWLANHAFYTNEQYLSDSTRILAAVEFDYLDWVGTSMGGLIGIGLAARTGTPIRRMVINDVGPFIPGEALQLIKTYLVEHPRFRDRQQAERYFRETYAGFGALDDHHYQHLVDHGIAVGEDDDLVLNYDPAIVDAFVATPSEDIELWPLWRAIDMPVLIIRGEKSGLLLPETVSKMKVTNSRADAVEFRGCAHAPSLMVDEQIKVVSDWLLRSQ